MNAHESISIDMSKQAEMVELSSDMGQPHNAWSFKDSQDDGEM